MFSLHRQCVVHFLLLPRTGFLFFLPHQNRYRTKCIQEIGCVHFFSISVEHTQNRRSRNRHLYWINLSEFLIVKTKNDFDFPRKVILFFVPLHVSARADCTKYFEMRLYFYHSAPSDSEWWIDYILLSTMKRIKDESGSNKIIIIPENERKYPVISRKPFLFSFAIGMTT